MRRVLLAAMLVLLTGTARAVQDDVVIPNSSMKPATIIRPEGFTPPDDAETHELTNDTRIAATLKLCLKGRDNENFRKTYSKEENENYCSCFAVLMVERVAYDEWIKIADMKGTHPISRATVKYCADKYLNLPDVTKIKNKKW